MSKSKTEKIRQRKENAEQCMVLAQRHRNEAKYWEQMAQYWDSIEENETEDDSGGTPGGPVPPPPRP
jgi:hypothetical protein